MLDASTRKTYLHYILPSTLAFLLEGIYGIVDGLFVGQTTGDVGLAGINVAYPLVALAIAVGTGLGMGGAVISSIYAGTGEEKRSTAAIGHTMSLLVLASVSLMIILLVFGEPLLYAIGGRDEVLRQAGIYLSVIAWGSVFQVLGAGSIPLMRNKGKVVYSMIALLTGGTTNCILDALFIFIFGWGVFGAALATLAAQVVVLLFSVVFWLRPQNRDVFAYLKPQLWLFLRTVRLGFAPFALTLLPEITTVVINIAAQREGGSPAIAAFAVVSYSAVAVQWIIQGITDGSQPLISRAFGAGNKTLVGGFRRTNYVITVILGIAGMLALWALRIPVAQLFGVSEQATVILDRAMIIFTLSLGLYGISHTTTSFFYATESNRYASILIVGEVASMIGFSLILPACFGLDGVWMTVVASQIVLVVLTVILRFVSRSSFDARITKQKEHVERLSAQE